MLGKIKHIYFVGIGGIGMSGIVELLLNLGYRVSGSDLRETQVTRRLQRLGAKVYIGHRASQIEAIDVLVISSIIGADNEEVMAAREKLIPVIPRAEMLAELMRLKYGIVIAGTHGKTTTTSMVATVLAQGGMDPTIVVGGRLNSLDSNAKLGSGEYIVAEADESDGSFLKLTPTIAVVTTIDAEHLDYYGTLENIKHDFLQFINKVPFYGAAVLCLDQKNIQDLIPQIQRRYITYGLNTQADLMAEQISSKEFQSRFNVLYRGRELGWISMNIPGLHNVYNSLAAVGVGLDLGLEFSVIKAALEGFAGADRRFQLIGEVGNVLIVDDYAHHPTEIEATLQAAKRGWGRRTVVVFQPHRYTRTRDLLGEFLTAFYQADVLIVTDIYPASEKPIPGVSAQQIVDGVRDHGHRNVVYIPRMEDVIPYVLEVVKPQDMLLTLGAGSIGELGAKLKQELEAKA
jgi:UDP-N-acetylmuramate--alanine ligase